MTAPTHPATSAFLSAQQEAQHLRPSATGRVRPEEFLAYRTAVRAMSSALAAAEQSARRAAGEPPAPGVLTARVEETVRRVVRMTRTLGVTAAEAVAEAAGSRTAGSARPASGTRPAAPDRGAPAPSAADDVPGDRARIWPVPSRTPRPGPVAGRRPDAP